jgi:hypothetical protein
MSFDLDGFIKQATAGLEDPNAGKGAFVDQAAPARDTPKAADVPSSDDKLGQLLTKMQGPKAGEPRERSPDELQPAQEFTLPATGDPVPAYANGTSPSQAIPESPLNIDQRALFSAFGNRAGVEKALRQQFEDVKPDPADPEKFVVKDQGVWKKLDPDNTAWETTKNLLSAAGKALNIAFNPFAPTYSQSIAGEGPQLDAGEREALGDVADITREVGIAGTALATAALTGGASIPIQAAAMTGTAGAARTMQTSMGRAVGTYDATAAEQLQDVGTEMLWALGGEAMGVGIRQGARGAVKAIQGIQKNLPRWSAGSKTLGADLMSKLMGIPGRALDEAFDPQSARRIEGIMRSFGRTGAHADEIAFKIGEKQLDLTRQLMKSVEGGIDDIWTRGMGQTAKLVSGKNFKLSAQELIRPMREFALDSGLAKVQERVVTGAGKSILRDVPLDRLQQELTKRGGQLPKSWQVRPTKYEEALNVFKAKGQPVPELLMDSQEGFKELQKFVMQSEQVARASGTLEGAKGFTQMTDLLKNFKKATFSMKLRAQSEGLNAASNAAVRLASGLDTAVESALKTRGLDDVLESYSKTKLQFSNARNETQTFLGLWDKYKRTKDLNVLGKLGDDMLAGSSRKFQQTSGMDFVTNQLFKETASQRMAAQTYQDLILHDSAKHFLPLIGKGRGSLAATAAVGSLAAGNPVVAAGFAASAALSSPRIGFKGIRAYQSLIGEQTTRAAKMAAFEQRLGLPPQQMQRLASYGLQTVNFMRNLGGKGLNAVAQDETAVRTLLQTMVRSASQEAQGTDQLVNQATNLPPGITPEDLQ